MAASTKILSPDEITQAAPAGWRMEDGLLTARFATGDFATGLELVARLGASAESANHHPDVTLTYPTVTVTLTSHDVGGVTGRDIALAQQASEHAAALGVDVAAD
ncbi:4a-hydroxytetrahydrobiopterin dehydratase [Brachybacterium saurashtrense]|uniref:Putative pterin-4-alpha-carbinolamine dehydratase n=1 Tax=Brachybacterium saurashtrense TaxID=556288 RepID=A0A345YP30_9MICO|nr:4a-hydroxytetrahydrobiopterin dehydratase [Brachybacterium saurashtrense]AXK45682.1 4a-hydroxytetrahydrobiopterin dehydratase [Brachybacterium saurashtrense]RRR24699.1 4a-hydroxytetrahydrobiopterin dehydratase [Brachybacterium saurashtrense]